MAAPPRSYAEFFSEPSNNPLGTDPTDGYREIFTRWRVDNNPPSAAELHRDVLTDFDSTIGAVGYFVKDSHSGSGILKVAHGFRPFAGLPGRPSPHRGATFAYVGDVVAETDIETFKVAEEQFGMVTETRCASTPERHQELFNAEPDEDLVGPIDQSSQAQQMIKTRKSMFIPFVLVEYVLGKDLSAREAFEILWPVIQTNNMRDVAKPLVKWLMVAATKHNARREPRTVNDELGEGMTGAADILSDRRKRILYQHLPGLQPTPATTGDPQMTALVAQLATMNDQARLDRVDRREAREKASAPKTIREHFGDYTSDKLLVLTGVAADDDLPKIYHELAARAKGVSKRMLLQESYDITADELDINRLPASPSHVIDLDNWDFTGTSHDALGTGLLPFSVIPPDAPSKQGRKAILEDQERTRVYDMSGDAVNGAMSTTDAKKLYNSKGYIPTEWTEATLQIEQYLVVLGTILGPTHDVTKSYQSALKLYSRTKVRLQAGMDRKFGNRLAPALLVLYFQLNTRSWFEERWQYSVSDNRAPDYSEGIRTYVRANRYDWLPSHEDISALQGLHNTTSTGGNPSGSRGTSTTSGGGHTPNTQGGGGLQTRVQNPHRDSRFVGNTPLAVNIRTRSIRNAITLAGVDPPQVERGGQTVPTCLSWHVKGVCSASCARAADHVQNSPEEKEALYQWCVPAFA